MDQSGKKVKVAKDESPGRVIWHKPTLKKLSVPADTLGQNPGLADAVVALS